MGLLGLFLPRRCAGCEVPGPVLCERCLAALVRIAPPVCEHCRMPGCVAGWTLRAHAQGRRLAFARARAALVYDARARPIVSAWKERGRRDLAQVLADLACRPRRRAAGGRRARRCARRSGAREGARPRARCASRAGTRRPLAAAGRISPRPHGSDEPPAGRPASRRARGEHPRGAFTAVDQAPARIALVDDVYTSRGDRVRVRDGASPGRGTSRRGHLPRADGAVG